MCSRASLSSSRAHTCWRGGRSPRLGGGARGASLSCASCPPTKAGCPWVRSPQAATLQAPAGSVQREHWSLRGPVYGDGPSPLWPTHRIWSSCPTPWCHVCHCTCVSPGQKPLSWLLCGAQLSGNPHLQSCGGGPRPSSTSVPKVFLIQYNRQQLSPQGAGWSPGSGADSPEADV